MALSLYILYSIIVFILYVSLLLCEAHFKIIQEQVKCYIVQLTGHVSNGRVCDRSLA